MTVEMLMDAIDNIDDSYIEKVTYGRKRLAKAPWGMIASAACLCLVIVATIILHNAGRMPYFNGPSDATKPPVVTDPSGTTIPSQTTRPEADPEELNAVRALFSNRNGWYYRALVDPFISPKALHLRYYFYNSTEFGEGLQPNSKEMTELLAWEDYQEGKTLTILPVSKMDPILKETFGITVEEMDGTAFAGMKYAESIDSWCFWGLGELNVNQISIQDVVKETEDLFRVVYTASEETYEVVLKSNGDRYHILSNMNLSSEPDNTRPSVEEFFLDKGSWPNAALGYTFQNSENVKFYFLLKENRLGEGIVLTDQEKKLLDDKLTLGLGTKEVWRLTPAQIDDIFWSCYGLTWEEVMSNFDLSRYSGWNPLLFVPVYLEETGCYYGYVGTEKGTEITDVEVEYCDDGTIDMFYTAFGSERRVAKLRPHDTGYHILSNMKVSLEVQPDPTDPTETVAPTTPPELEKYNTIFGDYNGWYNRALVCEYAAPEELSLVKFFYRGFADEPKRPTDAEWAQLKNQPGFEENFDLFRLPVYKMNVVLMEYFGITLEDVKPEGFENLVYLESTNCYYFMTTGALVAENFTALSVDETDYGTICVEYQCAYPANTTFVVTLKPNGEGYQILSNVLADGFRPYKVDAAQLNALLQEVANGNLTERRKEEILLPLMGTFLEDPDLFVSSLAKQQKSQAEVMQIFASTINYIHPRYAAYNQTIRAMLPKVHSEEHKRIVYWMAFYSGLGNFLPQTPGAQDYALLFDMLLYSDGAFAEGCAYRMEQYCKGDPTAYAAAMGLTKEEHWDLYAFQTVAFMKQEDRALVKQSMTEVIEDIKHLEGYDIKAVTACAELIIKYCDNPIK